MQKNKETMARPSKYETHVLPKLKLVEGWARDGLTDEEIVVDMKRYFTK